MYGVFTYIYHKNQPNVGVYTIHGSYGIEQKVIQGVVVGQKSSNNIGNKWKTVRFFWNASGTWERTVIQTSWNGESPRSAFRTHMTFHYTDWLIGIITMAYGNPYIKLGRCNPPKTQQITRVNWSLLTWISATTLWEALSWPKFDYGWNTPWNWQFPSEKKAIWHNKDMNHLPTRGWNY